MGTFPRVETSRRYSWTAEPVLCSIAMLCGLGDLSLHTRSSCRSRNSSMVRRFVGKLNGDLDVSDVQRSLRKTGLTQRPIGSPASTARNRPDPRNRDPWCAEAADQGFHSNWRGLASLPHTPQERGGGFSCRAMYTSITGQIAMLCDGNNHAALRTIPF